MATDLAGEDPQFFTCAGTPQERATVSHRASHLPTAGPRGEAEPALPLPVPAMLTQVKVSSS